MNYRAFPNFILFAFFGLLIAHLVSCASKQSQTIDETQEVVDFPVGYIATTITTDITDVTTLYPLSQDFIDSFMDFYLRYDGTKPTVVSEFPNEWGVVIVERLPEGREIFQIQSLNREWIYLVITSGFGTQRILDVLPVAVNLVYQSNDVLEKEIWTMQRSDDGAFIVSKSYEWVRSISKATQKEFDANPEAFSRASIFTETYILDELSRFQITETTHIQDYQAAIFYYKGEKPENFVEVVSHLQAFCEDYDIFFEEVSSNFQKVTIQDYKLNFIDELDISAFVESAAGMVLIKKGETPKNILFGDFYRMQIEMKRYFKIIENKPT